MITRLAAAATGAVLLALAFPPVKADLLAWVAFVPFFASLRGNVRPATAAGIGLLFGGVFFLIDVRWVHVTLMTHGHFSSINAILMLVALVGILSLFPAAFALIFTSCTQDTVHRALAAPFLWTALEFVRAHIFTGFPWDLAGYSQVNRLIVMQVVDVTGVYGVSFLVVLVNAAVWGGVQSLVDGKGRALNVVLPAAVLLCATLGYGSLKLREYPAVEPGGPGFPVAILQGNIEQDLKWDPAMRQYTFLTYETLGAMAVSQGARLPIWPETAAPVVFGGEDPDWGRTEQISRRLGVPMVVGVPSQRIVAGETNYYNSALLIDGSQVLAQYDKIHLVPFGEYMPLSWLLPLGPGIAAREADYTAGRTMTVMSVPGCPDFSVLICYEAIFPELARKAVREGARMLLNLTNDGWFGDSAAPLQHLAMAGVRAIENRVWLLRAANTGVSAGFDPAGRMVGSIPLQQQGMLMVTVPESPRVGSVYTRYGDFFAMGCFAACLVWIGTAYRGKPERARRSS